MASESDRRLKRTRSPESSDDEELVMASPLSSRRQSKEQKTTAGSSVVMARLLDDGNAEAPLTVLKSGTTTGKKLQWPIMGHVVNRIGIYASKIAAAKKNASPHGHVVITDEVQRTESHMLAIFAFLTAGTLPIAATTIFKCSSILAKETWDLCILATEMEVDGFCDAVMPRLAEHLDSMTVLTFYFSAKYFCAVGPAMTKRHIMGKAIIKSFRKRMAGPNAAMGLGLHGYLERIQREGGVLASLLIDALVEYFHESEAEKASVLGAMQSAYETLSEIPTRR